MLVPALDDAVREATTQACAAAGVTVRELSKTDDLAAVVALFAGVWETPVREFQLGTEVLRALSHAGNYVAAAFDEKGEMVGASLAFLGMHGGLVDLHSHITAVVPHARGGTGFALKQHQRAWSLARGVERVRWTFDPLVRRNAYFNLTKLGAEVVDYQPDFYGAMGDSVNKGDHSDRCVAQWDLISERAVGAAAGDAAEPDLEALRVEGAIEVLSDHSGSPRIRTGEAQVLLCWVPEDIVALRRSDPELAGAWRLALRDTLGRALDGGYRATGMTRSGWFVLAR